MAELTLYNYELDEDCYRVRLLFGFLDIEWKPASVDMMPGGQHKQPPLIELNPLGDLPILDDGGFVVSGVVAILCYLARRAGAVSWAPFADAKRMAQMMCWLEFSARQLAVARQARWASLFGVEGDPAELAAEVRTALGLMEDHMTRRGYAGAHWFAGEGPTLADVALFPAFALSRDYGVGHEEFPALRRWTRRVRALPGFRSMPGIPGYY